MPGFEVIQGTKKVVDRFAKKTMPAFIKACIKLGNELTTYTERYKKLFTNPSENINADLSAYNEKAYLAIGSLETGTTTAAKTPEQTAKH